jgi:predicted ATP-grasp superfamily ATP-dependent carboligase
MNLPALRFKRRTTVAPQASRTTEHAGPQVQSARRYIPAVVVGAAGPCGLGIVRSLAAGGIPVVLADPNPAEPAMHTRLARKHLISALSGRGLVDDLLALRQTFDDSPILFLTSDEAVATVSEYRSELAGQYRIRLPSHDCVMSLMDKTSFQRQAEERGFPVPRAVRIKHPSDLSALDGLQFPCIVKPSVKSAEYIRHRLERAYKVESREHAVAVCCRILPIIADVLVQEWIEGGDENLYFCLQYCAGGGQAVCSFTGRKLSIWPPEVGITASCTVAADAHPKLQPLTESFFQSVAFTGMGSIEFKKDARSGRFLMIEPTVGRADGQEEVATIHGTNLPLAAYCHELGLARPAANAHTGQQLIWQDTLNHWRAIRRGAAPAEGPRSKICDAYWRTNDPMPALFHGLSMSTKLLQWATKRTGKPCPI